MKRIAILILIISLSCYSQKSTLSELEKQQKEIQSQINKLSDSLNDIKLRINRKKSNKLIKSTKDSTIIAKVSKDAKLRKDPSPLGKIIVKLGEEMNVKILDFIDGYYKICTDSNCGYLSEIYVYEDSEMYEFKRIKKKMNVEKKRKRDKEITQEIKNKLDKLEKKYIRKYGKRVYTKLKNGHYWIGMNKDMAKISLGQPKDINRTVTSNGVSEQWVYNGIYLYFDDGVLTSFQD